MIPKVGEAIGPFTLVKVLGQGGMGAVFVARHTNGVDAALKVLLDPDPAILERFKREISSMGRVDRHPGVVRVHTAGTFGPQALPYVVMDLVRGTDLSKTIGKRPIEPLRAAAIVEKVARAVEHCHAQGVIHRDLKPANVLIRAEDQEPLVTDFGLAREDTAERLTRTGELLGTPAYMAPEQIEGDRTAQDRRTDVYALGAILYECLTGEPPFKADSATRLMKMVLIDDPVDPRKLVPAVPVDLAVIALKCLSKERERRYQTAKGLAEELGRVTRGEPILARPETASEKRRRWIRKHRREVALGGAALTAVLLAAGALVAFAVFGRLSQKDPLALAVEAAEGKAREAGFPALPDRPRDDLAPVFAELRKAMGSATAGVGTALVLDRWERLSRDPAATLAAPSPSDERLVGVLDSVAAIRVGSKELVATVKARLDGAARDMLAAHESGRLSALVKAFRALSESEQTAWRPAFEERTVEGFGAWCADPDDALEPVLDAPDASALGALRVRLATTTDLGDWQRLAARRPKTAVRFMRVLDPRGARFQEFANRLSSRAAELLKTGERVDRRARDEAFGLLRAVIELGAAASGDALAALYDCAGYQETGVTPDNIECFYLLVALGTMPDMEFLNSGRPEQNAAARLDLDESLARTAEEFLRGASGKEPLARLIAGLTILHAVSDAHSVFRNEKKWKNEKPPEAAWRKLHARGCDVFDAAAVEPLGSTARAFERYERGILYLKALLPLQTELKGSELYSDPQQMAFAKGALSEASGYDRPWALQKARVEVEMRTLKHLNGEATNVATDADRARLLASGEETLHSLVEHVRIWEVAVKEVVDYQARFPSLADAGSVDDRRRLTVLSNVYRLQATVAILTEPLNALADGHTFLAALSRRAGDGDSQRRHAEAAVTFISRAIEIAPERPKLRIDRAYHYVTLGKNAEARVDLEAGLNARPVAGGIGTETRRAAEETLKNLK